LHQHGDGESTLLFDLADFAAVAGIVKPWRRRQPKPLTEAQIQNLAKYAFQAGPATQSRESMLEPPISLSGGQMVTQAEIGSLALAVEGASQ
jgi:hypothetical protein